VELTGADILVRALGDEGVEYVFGYPGGAALHIYDALYQQDKVKHILARHEQGAGHAADGYARSCGKPGVVLVTSGPGVTNVVTPLATAYMDSIPMVVITAQVPSHLIGDDAFQEVDSVGITRPCVKHNFLVKDVRNLATTVKKAFHLATTGRPGPVVVDVPKDITAFKTKYVYPSSVSMRSYQPVTEGHPGQIRKALQLLLKAKRPIIYTGGGVIASDSSAKLVEFVRLLGMPITNTLMGLGAYPASDPLFIGMLGMHGTYEANLAMHECDVMLNIGARFDDRVTGDTKKFSPHAKIIHVDIDPSSISKTIACDVPIVGSANSVLGAMIEQLKSSGDKPDPDALADWWAQINGWRKIDCLAYDQGEDVIKPQYVVQKLHEVSGGDAFVTSDVGQHQMFAAQYYGFDKPRRWINSGGLGTMGVGLPYAMGVQLAHPDATVACVTGEGSIQMCIQELSTCSQYDLPVNIINLNNRYLGMVRQWQEFFFGGRYVATPLLSPDFVKIAEAHGLTGICVESRSEVEDAVRTAEATEGTVVIDFRVEQEDAVYPMVPAGANLHDMIERPEPGTHQHNPIFETGEDE
jgi:acetolactate synthase-1/2/3 large subunit